MYHVPIHYLDPSCMESEMENDMYGVRYAPPPFRAFSVWDGHLGGSSQVNDLTLLNEQFFVILEAT